MFAFEKIVEQKIQEAMKRGEFDNLELKGQPLNLEDLSGVPEDLRMGFKVLKNAGILPEEMQLRKDIANMKELIASGKNGIEPETEKAKLTGKILRLKMMLEKGKSGK